MTLEVYIAIAVPITIGILLTIVLRSDRKRKQKSSSPGTVSPDSYKIDAWKQYYREKKRITVSSRCGHPYPED